MLRKADNLLSLPEELLECILVYSEAQDVISCSQACRTLHRIATNSINLKYKLACSTSRMRDGGISSSMNTRDRLQSLHQSGDAWRTMRRTEESWVQNIEGALDICGSTLLQKTEDGTRVQAVQLPSPSRGIKARSWELPRVDYPFVDFTYDETQDLLIIVDQQIGTAQLHILAASTGKAHLKAAVPCLSAELDPGCEVGENEIRVCGNLMGFMSAPDALKNEFWVWDWREGVLLMNLVGELDPPLRQLEVKTSFSFWDDRHVLIPLTDNFLAGHPPRLAIFDCYEQRGFSGSFKNSWHAAKLIFDFPQPARGAFYDMIDIVRDSSTMCSTHLRHGVPFYPDHRSRIIVVTFLMFSSTGLSTDYAMIIPWDAIGHFLAGTDKHIRWDAWGAGTLVFPIPEPSYGLPLFTACAGRYATCQAVDGDGDKVVVVYDCASPAALRKEMASATDKSQYVFTATVLEEPETWGECLRTSLPHRRVVSDIVLRDSESLMITEDCLLILDDNPHGQIRVLSF